MPEWKGASASSWLSNLGVNCDGGSQDSFIGAYDLHSQVGEHSHANDPFDLLGPSYFYKG